MLQIIEVELQATQHLRHRIGITIVKGGIGCYARTYLVQELVAGIVLHYLVDIELTFRTRPDESHVTDEDIPQLGQLVEMMLAQELAHLGQSRVLAVTIELWPIFLCIHSHAPKLVDMERTAKTPYALLAEYRRTTVFPLHHDVTYQEERREHYQANACQHHVAYSFDIALELVHSVWNKALILYIGVKLDVRRNLWFFIIGSCHFCLILVCF